MKGSNSRFWSLNVSFYLFGAKNINLSKSDIVIHAICSSISNRVEMMVSGEAVLLQTTKFQLQKEHALAKNIVKVHTPFQ